MKFMSNDQMSKRYEKYCCGCGLCNAKGMSKMVLNNDGFYVANTYNKINKEFYEKICPTSGIQVSNYDTDEIWGMNSSVFLAYSADEVIRSKASSGGVLTSLCLYLVEKKIVDGIIHTGADPNNPIKTKTFCSVNRKELLSRCGSRYSMSMPLIDIDSYFTGDKVYAYVGKPCDVTALRNYSKVYGRVNKHIKYMFSFFCAGTPSEKANLHLLEELNTDLTKCKTLSYRGNGWPGYTTAVDKNGDKHSISYTDAWRNMLGRQTRLICRMCLDGVGEMADIACGDAWYLDDNMEPIFLEAEGRNIVFCRNVKGAKLMNAAIKAGYIKDEEYPNWNDEISCSQKYQYKRRASMLYVILAMKLMLRVVPKYGLDILLAYSKKANLREKVGRFVGTLKRILKGKI